MRPRRTNKNKRKPNYVAIARNVVLVFLMGQLLHVAFASPKLAVRTIRLEGTRRVPEKRVLQLADVKPGSNIFAVNLSRVRKRVLWEPLIKSAVVTRVLPGTIRIQVQERVPRMVAISNGRFWEVDEEGVVFGERSLADVQAQRPLLPRLQMAAGETLKVGTRFPADRWRTAWHALELASQEHVIVRRILFDGHGELWLNVAIPGVAGAPERILPVRFGRSEELALKFAHLRSVLPSAVADGEYLDLMSAGRAAYRKISADAATPPPGGIPVTHHQPLTAAPPEEPEKTGAVPVARPATGPPAAPAAAPQPAPAAAIPAVSRPVSGPVRPAAAPLPTLERERPSVPSALSPASTAPDPR